MSPDGEDEGGGGPNDGRSESFADLIGETKPLANGPARVDRVAMDAKPPRARNAKTPTITFRHPDPDEPRLGAAPGVNDIQLYALGRGEPEPREKIDLHGLRRDAAARLLVDRIQSARARDLRCVVVVHGRGQHAETGEAVLRDAVPGWLSKNPNANHVLAFAPAPNRFGGDGAVLVLLRRT